MSGETSAAPGTEPKTEFYERPSPELHLMNRHGKIEKAVPVAMRAWPQFGGKTLVFMVPESDVDTVQNALDNIIDSRALLMAP